MALTNSQHDAIMRIYDAIRTENRHIQNERYAQVTAACPEIAQIEDDIIGPVSYTHLTLPTKLEV